MTARLLEAAGIATVIIGAAIDIVTWCRVPRYLHNELPLGNPMGKPYDQPGQRDTLEKALALFETADSPVVADGGLTWADTDDWKANFLRVDDSNREQLRQMGEARRQKRDSEKAAGLNQK